MKLSITLPSIHPKALQRTLRNIRAATQCEHEVIVVSPFEPVFESGHVQWVKDFIMEGCNAGHALGLTEATGEFVFPWVDDHLLTDDWDVAAITEFEARESVLLYNRPFMLGLRQMQSSVGTCFGIYYPYFPLMRTVDARKLGWYKPEYRKGFADVDLAFRVWVNMGRVEWSNYELILRHIDDMQKGETIGYTPEDMSMFLERWAPVYGRNWKSGCDQIRDFNRDIPISSIGMGTKTFSPDFRAFT